MLPVLVVGCSSRNRTNVGHFFVFPSLISHSNGFTFNAPEYITLIWLPRHGRPPGLVHHRSFARRNCTTIVSVRPGESHGTNVIKRRSSRREQRGRRFLRKYGASVSRVFFVSFSFPFIFAFVGFARDVLLLLYSRRLATGEAYNIFFVLSPRSRRARNTLPSTGRSANSPVSSLCYCASKVFN